MPTSGVAFLRSRTHTIIVKLHSTTHRTLLAMWLHCMKHVRLSISSQDDMLSATQPGDRSALPSVLTLALFEDSGYVWKGWPRIVYAYVHVYSKRIKLSCDCGAIVCTVTLSLL